jgi:hypothetical protein
MFARGTPKDFQLTKNVQHETQETMVGCEWQQYPIHQQNMLEIVDDALSVKEVHGRSQEVPV